MDSVIYAINILYYLAYYLCGKPHRLIVSVSASGVSLDWTDEKVGKRQTNVSTCPLTVIPG